jgi:hypothetical protein
VTDTDVASEVRALLDLWTDAERRGDMDELTTLLHARFRGIGADGLLLDAREWIARHRGAPHHDRYELTEVDVRRFGVTAVVSAVLTRATAAPHHAAVAAPDEFRAGLVAVWGSEGWTIVQIQLSILRRETSARRA